MRTVMETIVNIVILKMMNLSRREEQRRSSGKGLHETLLNPNARKQVR
jgi:hypothetical protein